MVVELISVGTEILLGDIVNTNAAYLSKQCAALGLNMYAQSVVGDNDERLKELFEEAFKRSDVVILTGGLGPTEDDLTKETVCRAMGVELVRDEKAENNMINILTRLGYTPSKNNFKQAMVPKNGIILYNNNGTAPGMIIEKDGHAAVLLPGPPGEMIPMFEEYLIPYFSYHNPEVLYSMTIKECGIGESLLETRLLDLIDSQTNPTIATYAKTGCSEVRITAKAPTMDDAVMLVKPVADEVLKRLEGYVYSTDEKDNLEDVLVRLLKDKNLKIATAESCTGGLIGTKIVNVSGASNVYAYGYITYSDDAKCETLGVSRESIEKYTAVSDVVAMEMANGARVISGADIAVSVTGYAGPYDLKDEPKGLVYIGCSTAKETKAYEFRFSGNRQKIRENAAVRALDTVRRTIEEAY